MTQSISTCRWLVALAAGLGCAGVAQAGDTLSANQSLYPGQAIVSADGRTSLAYQGDGNLVLYKDGSPLWASGTAGSSTDRTLMQSDGNLVVYDAGGVPQWASGTQGYAGAVTRAVDGDAVVCLDSTRLWTATGAGSCATGGGGGGGGGGVSGTYVGCWTDSSSRALPAFLGGAFDVGRCVNTARQQGYAYAGLQWYGECWAGNELRHDRAAESDCNTPCGANPSQICGGGYRNSVYATGARDVDADAVSDDMEAALAGALMPYVFVHRDEQCPWPLPKPVAYRLRFPRCTNGFVPTDWIAVNYYILYSQDCGLLGHSGDNEGLVVLGRRVGGQWRMEWISAIAHASTSAEKHTTAAYPHNWITTSRNKHANYTNLQACAEHITDDCEAFYYYSPLSFSNVGEPNRHLIDSYGQINPSFWGTVWGGKMMSAGESHWTLWDYWMPSPPPGCSWWDTWN